MIPAGMSTEMKASARAASTREAIDESVNVSWNTENAVIGKWKVTMRRRRFP